MSPGSSPADQTIHGWGRLLTATYAAGVLTATLLTLFVGRQMRETRVEITFGLLNVPVAPTFLSVVVLALITGTLAFRKRIGLWLVAAFQVFGIYLGVLALIGQPALPLAEAWETRGDLGRGLDIVSMLIAIATLAGLRRLRTDFSGRLRRGSWVFAGATLALGGVLTAVVAWALLTATRATGADLGSLLRTGVHALTGTAGGRDERWISDVVATLLGLSVIAAVVAFLATSRRGSDWTPDREIAIRRMLRASDPDSLGYFATRRDRSAIFSPDQRAVVTYRVIGGVSMAAGDPLGRRESWPDAIGEWKAEARRYGWTPAVLGASEAGAAAYAREGLRALCIGDEAILHPAQFDLRRISMTPVRHAAKRAARSGITVRIRRQGELEASELREVEQCAEAWRGDEPERGFSMALNRAGDPADERILFVTAHFSDGRLASLLSFVPWGRSGISLDLMRRSPDAPNGITELLVTELLAHAGDHGVRRVSLNFCMFRRTYADAERIGAGSLTRASYSILGVLDRFWQLERLYRSNQKYEPEWVPRFLCYEDVISLPHVALAAGAAEGFVPWRSPGASGHFTEEQLSRVRSLETEPADPATTTVRRSDQTRTRLARLELLRDSGVDAYPVGTGAAPDTICDLCTTWAAGAKADVVGRIVRVRDFGGVVFAGLRDGPNQVQILLDSGRIGRAHTRSFTRQVDEGDLVGIRGRLGESRTGTPSLLVNSWQILAKCLHPLPWRGAHDGDARSRHRAVDLLVDPDGLEAIHRRSAVIGAIRQTLATDGYVEVETPMLQVIHGGASARPFRTFSNAYGIDLFLRIAPELFLKRLLVAGAGPIYEMGRNFRNEGADATHNPEFTSLEVYQPFGDYTTMRHLAERLVRAAARAVHGREVIPAPVGEQIRKGLAGVGLVDIAGDWPVVPMLAAVGAAVGRDVDLDTDPDVLLGIARQHDIPVRADMGPGAILEELYAELVEPATIAPTFYTDFPVETSPLTRPHRSAPGLVERWDLVIGGMEVATAYSELTDPIEQRERLTTQSLKAAGGDPEAMQLDEDFLHDLELGMPPAGGLGIGIDRLAMLVTNAPIRGVLAFPFMRPTTSRGH